jgi:hypothetical protein
MHANQPALERELCNLLGEKRGTAADMSLQLDFAGFLGASRAQVQIRQSPLPAATARTMLDDMHHPTAEAHEITGILVRFHLQINMASVAPISTSPP